MESWRINFKRIRLSFDSAKDEMTKAAWHNLPELAAIKVMAYLDDFDRCNMALTCKSWAKVLHTARLWRKRKLSLGLDPVLDKREVLYLEKMGSYLHHLGVHCNRIGPVTSYRLKENLTMAMMALEKKKPRLTTLSISGLGLDRLNRFSVPKDTDRHLVNSMCSFFRTQRRLRIVKLPGAYVRLVTGKRLLQALTKYSGKTVSNLNLVDLFHHGLAMYRVPQFENIMSAFKNLRRLGINYNCLCEDILESLAKSNRGTLRYLTIRVNQGDPHGHLISGATWKRVTTLCPNLRVDFEFDGICAHHDIVPILVPQIPMWSLRVWTGLDLDDDSWVPGFLSHVTENFSHSLVRLDLSIDNCETYFDESILILVTRCKKLKSLSLSGMFISSLVEDICLLQRENKIGLLRFRATSCFASVYDCFELHMVMEDFAEMITSRGLDFTFETDPPYTRSDLIDEATG